MNFLPLLPYDQNKLLFGEGRTKPHQAPDFAQILVRNELEDMLKVPVDYPDYEETKTQLPDLRGYEGPHEALTVKSVERWSNHLEHLEELATSTPSETPTTLLRKPGWTFYPTSPDYGEIRSVDYPGEDAFLYDTETYVKGGNHPLIGVAASMKGWYVWLHPQLCAGFVPDQFKPMTIPLGPKRLVVAHNVMFDLSKSTESYELGNENRPVGFCTMAAHGCIAAMGGEQVVRAFKSITHNAPLPWTKTVCGDSLRDCLQYYVGMEVSKEARDLFVMGSFQDILDNFDELLAYAVKDVESLWWLLLALWPKFRLAFPSMASLVGLLELSRSLLPIVSNYDKIVAANSIMLDIKTKELEGLINGEMAKILVAHEQGQDFTECPWLGQMDWTPAKSGKNKGKPLWWRKLKGGKLTMKARIVPLILKCTWNGEPLVYQNGKGWGYNSPDNGGKWEKLPHPDGPKSNVGSPLSKAFRDFATKGILGTVLERNLPKELANLGYWVSYQSRFEGQYKSFNEIAPKRLGIVPTTKLIGTLTARQVEKTWLTAAQCKGEKLGTDMFHCIQPPEGWDLVLWDEDTEEVRIAALWGDMNRGLGLGCTAMSQIAFMGKKGDSLETSTDTHSVTAKLAQIPRPDAKIANFRDIFGGGRVTQSNALLAAHPDWSTNQIAKVVTAILDAKRGVKVRGKYEGGTDSFYHNQAATIADTPDFRLPGSGRLFPNVINPRFDTSGMFYTSRYNFPVQGTGVDILHFTAAAVPILCDEAGIPDDSYGYIMARHDEIAYSVKSEYSRKFAEAANAAHCWAWSIILEKMGFNWMPAPLARLSGINIDKVYRKETTMKTDCGYGLGWKFPDGEMIT